MFECYARTDVESRIWVQTLCRAIDTNHGVSAQVSGVRSPYFETVKKLQKGRKEVKYDPKAAQPAVRVVEGLYEYSSKTMKFSNSACSG